ncbi:hypothetical protein EO763_02725 [Pectobacterium odoriferum]|uniref:hypothetical protein n=1 Tax=Pectobacterium odoriferum TaxID=78398 RepID=UPI00137413C2|nr:hypothetical protein [Pectobacterium odoriferum]QHP78962.1 hypothetical protein EO763_02725 [Pectobacterium odoriferum]
MIINNVNMVLSREIIHGSLEVRNGVIHHISDRPSRHPGALAIFTQLNPKQLYLTQIGHELDRWFQTQTLLPQNVHAAYDGLMLGL